ncbi:serine/threonine protein kinase [Streptomyces yaizuensis]|uniref:non-specific serine/threonine protein kinase n=1 Tax=Streptomyces yaizuensis TaxID=2989713 RepID=A0ABQ5P5X9_9ACTN|nr:serine/threonine protein kinase [Streptomyces sp. YSPA8]
MADPGAGRRVGGRYRLLNRLGDGGMGTVWRAHDEVVDRDVAVKEPRVPTHLSAAARDRAHLRMQREARAAARIAHPSVVTVHDVVIEDDRPWIVMELVAGPSLADRLLDGPLDAREAARTGLAVLDGLAAAHAAGVLHRDVKPDNILLGPGGRVVLGDFGIARVEGEQGLTESGAFLGSPEFIAPERVLGRPAGPESDLWSLGVVLFTAVEGLSPYRCTNAAATLQAVVSAEPPPPARSTGFLGDLLTRLMRKDPAARPGIAEVRHTLETVARPPGDGGGTAPRPSNAPAAAPGGRRLPAPPRGGGPARYVLGGGALAVGAALALLLLTDPFGGGPGGLPEGWEVRSDREVVAADIAVPSAYRRAEGDRGSVVTYRDPSGVFRIELERVVPAEDEEALPPTEAAWRRHYEGGGANGTEIEDVRVTVAAATQQGVRAFDTTVDHVDAPAVGDDPLRLRWRERIVSRGEGADQVYWRLRVSGPAQGWAAEEGERLFDRVTGHLEIRDL